MALVAKKIIDEPCELDDECRMDKGLRCGFNLACR
jgi:hypothetical protein